MTQITRLEMELADALGVTQALRAAAADAAARVPGAKLRGRLERLDAQLAVVQEEVNALVVENGRTRTALTGRSRRLRDAEAGRTDGGDGLDALQALAAESAYALAQWRVVRRLAKAEGHKRARKLAKRAEPLAEGQLAMAFDLCDRLAKQQAAAIAPAG